MELGLIEMRLNACSTVGFGKSMKAFGRVAYLGLLDWTLALNIPV